MTYREMAGHKVSLLGFGCMRLPTLPDGSIDEATAASMIDEAMKAGVNYYDTAWMYHGGESEKFLGRTLSRYPRDSFYLATKLPTPAVTSRERAVEIFEEQLRRLQTDHFDFYLLHCLNRDLFENKVLAFDLIGLCEEWKRQGRIRHLGFSFHDNYESFERILCHYPWEFCQIQYNYMDTDNQAGDKGYALAVERGVPVVVMEPIRGGSLTRFPDEIHEAFAALDPDRNLANWALSWVATHPGVKVVLSGMSAPEQVRDNLRTFSDFTPLTEEKMQGVSSVVEQIRARVRNGCTGCRYCMPCPFGVDIPRAFAISNEEAMHGHTEAYRARYLSGKPETFASVCRSCGACETKCPQHLAIRRDLEVVAELFESPAGTAKN
ncbi:MAG: aldo/keto reductase [Clostridia bacterium]|nr:aldo/keto reductase [Clostridia bacterium]